MLSQYQENFASTKEKLDLEEVSGEDFLTDDDEDEVENVNPKKYKEQINSLRRKLKKTELLNENFQETIKTLHNKVELFSKTLSTAEEKHSREIKALRESTDFELHEKMNLCHQLKIYINQQEQVLHDLQQSNGEEILFNTSNSVTMFVKQINEVQDKLIKIQEENCQLKAQNEELHVEIAKLKDEIKEDYVSKHDYNLLLKEKEILSKTPRKPFEVLTPNTTLISKLKENGEELRRQLFESERENRTLRKKARELESKCTTLMYAPPKVHVREVIDENIQKELMEIKDEKFVMNLEMTKLKNDHKAEIKCLNETIREQEKKIDQLKSEGETNVKECRDIVTNIRDLRNQLGIMKKRNEQLEEQLSTTDQLHKLKIEDIQESEELYRQKHDKLQLIAKRLMEPVKATTNEIRTYKCQIERDLMSYMEYISSSMNKFKENILEAVADTNYRSNLLAERYKKELELRKKLHNDLVELKGNIRVFCRVRPVIREDGESCEQVVSFSDDEEDNILYVKNKGATKSFEMDRVFKPTATQNDVFEDVEALVTSCLDGYNVCIFAYGQTGAGKTFTMEGTKNDPGLNQRALKHLFNCSDKMRDWNFTILVNFVEIYNEMLRDLLVVEPTTKLNIKQNKDGSHYVPGLTHVQVKNVDDVNEVFSLGRMNRTTASTDMNERSSRSHSVLTILVLGRNINTNTEVSGKLNLVDLAGSERVSKSGSDGQRMKEAQNINKSLSALGDVIHALKNKNGHVPYRNTKLTYLLQESLGGDSKTLMVVQVSPVDKNAGETVCSLNFAQRVRQVELGMASRREQKISS